MKTIIAFAILVVVLAGCAPPDAQPTPCPTVPLDCFRHVLTDPPPEHELLYVLYTDKLDITLTYWVKAIWKNDKWYLLNTREPLCDSDWCFVWKPLDCKE